MKIIDNLAQRLYLGASKIPGAGVGLFAGQPILSGTPVCEYKGEIFDVESIEKDGDKPTSEASKRLSSKYSYTLQLGFSKPTPLYSIGWSDKNRKERKLIDAQPSLTDEAIGLGGFANDIRGWQERMKPEYAEKSKQILENSKTVEGIRENVKMDVEAGYNVTYWPHPTDIIIYLNSIRDIKAGEEIYVNYGDAYWSPFIEVIKAQAEKQEGDEKNVGLGDLQPEQKNPEEQEEKSE